MPPGGIGLDRSRQSSLSFAGFEADLVSEERTENDDVSVPLEREKNGRMKEVPLEEEDGEEEEERTERGGESEERAAIAGDIAAAVVIFVGAFDQVTAEKLDNGERERERARATSRRDISFCMTVRFAFSRVKVKEAVRYNVSIFWINKLKNIFNKIIIYIIQGN